MTEKERRIVEKLQALIKNTPYAGEKQTAINVLKNYCLKHNISEEELGSVELQNFEYIIKDNPNNKFDLWWLFEVIGRHYYERTGRNFFDEDIRYHVESKKKTFLFLRITSSDFVNLISEYEFYARNFSKEKRKAIKEFERNFFRAFLMKQDLLFESDITEEDYFLDPKEIAREQQVMAMAEDIAENKFLKQIEGAKKHE